MLIIRHLVFAFSLNFFHFILFWNLSVASYSTGHIGDIFLKSCLLVIAAAAAAAAKSLQSCPTLCDPIDGSPTGYPVPGILQARTLEWVAISFSNTGK